MNGQSECEEKQLPSWYKSRRDYPVSMEVRADFVLQSFALLVVI